jgi:hypothetical protein
VLPILPGGPLLLCSSPMGIRLDTSNQRTFLGEATIQDRCIAFRPFASSRSSLSVGGDIGCREVAMPQPYVVGGAG